MTPVQRWLRFNLVGLLGMVVQLGTLAFLNRLIARHYLLSTTLALELTLLHNYAWHRRYTWSDIPCRPHRLFRFHLSNGLLSLAGNLALMHLLVRFAHLPPVLANAIAIATCSLLNFAAAQAWAFAPETALQKGSPP